MSNNQKISGLGFHHINLRVRDFDRTVAFYTETLGMTRSYAWSEGENRFQMLDIGDGGILEVASCAGDETSNGVWNHFAMKVADAEAAYNSAVAGGARPKMPPKELTLDASPAKLNLRVAFVYGPDDEQIEFFQMR